MLRLKRIGFMLAVAMMLLAGTAFAQAPGPAAPLLDWRQLVLMALNGVGVFALVQVVKGLAPTLPAVAKQILALAAGPVLMMVVGPALSTFLGGSVEFGPLVEALTGLVSGATAITAFDLRHGK